MRRRLLIPLALGLAASLAALAIESAGALRRWELPATDVLMTLRGPRPPDPRVVICAVDAASVDLYGQWPWSRRRMAEIVDRLAAAGAGVIAFDVVFAEPSRSDEVVDLAWEDDALAAAMERAGNVVLGYYFRRRPPAGTGGAPPAGVPPRHGGDPTNIVPAAIEQVLGEPAGGFAVLRRQVVEPNIDRLAAAAASQGFFSTEGRRGGVARHYELVVAHGGRYYPALALRAVALLTGGELRLGPGAGRLPRLTLGGREVETDERGTLWLDHPGPAGTFPTTSVAELLAGRAPADAFAGRLVLFGATEPGIGDLHATPFGGDAPGVEVHAAAAENLLTGRRVHDTGVQALASLAGLLLLGPLVAALAGGIRSYALASAAAATAVLAWPVTTYAAFAGAGWHLQVLSPALAGGLALLVTLVYRIGFADRETRRIRHAFSRYVSRAVADEVLAHPGELGLGGEKRDLTVLFADIRGFTTLAEKLAPEEVALLLNRFFTPMTRLVLAAGGTLDKYMGDALMAFFGAPLAQADHAARACRAALEMPRELALLNAKLAAEGLAAEGLAIGVGLNSGEMVVGNMGSEEVFDYTVLGDNVNLGSRIEGLTRPYGVPILVSEATVRAAGEGFFFREIDRVRVKGKREPVTLYELVGADPVAAEERQRVVRFEAGLAAYRDRDFYRAERLFTSVLEDFGDDRTTRLYVERCRRFSAAPPADGWDGVETLASK